MIHSFRSVIVLRQKLLIKNKGKANEIRKHLDLPTYISLPFLLQTTNGLLYFLHITYESSINASTKWRHSYREHGM